MKYMLHMVVYLHQKLTLNKMTNTMQIKKLQIVEVPAQYQKEEGCVAFQMIEMTYSFYGKEIVDYLDTKILANGTQRVINGNGFIKDGYAIA